MEDEWSLYVDASSFYPVPSRVPIDHQKFTLVIDNIPDGYLLLKYKKPKDHDLRSIIDSIIIVGAFEKFTWAHTKRRKLRRVDPDSKYIIPFRMYKYAEKL